jgi:hypothetical protein
MDTNDLISGFAVCFLSLMVGIPILYATRNHRRALRFQVVLFIFALGLRFALSIALYVGGLVALIGDDDSIGWFGGVVRMEEWEQEGVGLFDLPFALLGAFQGVNRGYKYLIGAFFYLTRVPYRLPVAVLSCFFGALTVVLVYRIAEEIFSSWVAARVGWCTCIAPSLVIWSAQTVKEPIVIFLETTILYACMRFRSRKYRLKYIFICIFCTVFLVTLRFYAAYLGAVMVGVSLIAPRLHYRRGFSLMSALCASIAFIPMMIITWLLLNREMAAHAFDLSYIRNLKMGLATTANSGVLLDYDIATPSGFLLATFVGTAHLLLAPFPWQWENASLRMLLTLPEVLIWWILFFVGVIPGFRYAIRERLGEIIPLLVLLFGLGMLYSVTFGNIGLVYRQRAQLLPSLLIFAMVGFEQHALRRAKARQLSKAMKPAPEGYIPALPPQ